MDAGRSVPEAFAAVAKQHAAALALEGGPWVFSKFLLDEKIPSLFWGLNGTDVLPGLAYLVCFLRFLCHFWPSNSSMWCCNNAVAVKVPTFAEKRCWMWCLEHRNSHLPTPLATEIVSFFFEKFEQVCLLKFLVWWGWFRNTLLSYTFGHSRTSRMTFAQELSYQQLLCRVACVAKKIQMKGSNLCWNQQRDWWIRCFFRYWLKMWRCFWTCEFRWVSWRLRLLSSKLWVGSEGCSSGATRI